MSFCLNDMLKSVVLLILAKKINQLKSEVIDTKTPAFGARGLETNVLIEN